MPLIGEDLDQQERHNMKITAVLAMTEHCIIGNKNSLPWHIPEDLRRFRELTTGGVVIMGKNTYFSLPESVRPLPNRRNIVFSADEIAGVECVTSLDALTSLLAHETRPIFVIGGASIYNQFFAANMVDTVELTLITTPYEGDIAVEEFRHQFHEASREVFSEGFFITLIRS